MQACCRNDLAQHQQLGPAGSTPACLPLRVGEAMLLSPFVMLVTDD
jgi:hypothetical protein